MLINLLQYHLIKDEMQRHKDNDEKELRINDVDELQLQLKLLKMDKLKENVNDQVMFD
jgi:hypothetical protein